MIQQIGFNQESVNPFIELKIYHITEERKMFFGEWQGPSGKFEEAILNPAYGEQYVLDFLQPEMIVYVRQPKENTRKTTGTKWRAYMRPLSEQPIWVQEAVKSRKKTAPNAINLLDSMDPSCVDRETTKAEDSIDAEEMVTIPELAGRLGISRQTAYRRVDSLKIKVIRGPKGFGLITTEQANQVQELQARINSQRNRKAVVDSHAPALPSAAKPTEDKPDEKFEVEIYDKLDQVYLQAILFNVRNRSTRELPEELKDVKTCADIIHAALEHCRKSGFWLTKTQVIEGLKNDA